jgi:2-methylcitrate dehydratase PrpD
VEQITDTIAQFIYHTRLENISHEVIEMGKLHILDTMGVLFAGSKERITGIVKEYIQALGCKAESTLITQCIKTSAQYAAFGNGIMAHVLDFDDYEWPSMAHPSVTVLPAVLALGEKIEASGNLCMEAYLVGMEVISKIGYGVNPSHYDKGWHSTSTLGTLGAAAASAKLLNCDLESVKMVLGIASSMSSGLRGNFGTMTKAFHAGHAARCGVESAILASLGFTADKTILERELGFCSIFTDGKSYDLKKIVQNLGDPFSIVKPGIGIKPYPSCAATHSVLDGIFQLIKQHTIKVEDVDRVECGIFYLYPKILIHSEPRTGLEGKFSLEFCVAVALLDREVNLEKFTDEKVNRPEVQALIQKVKQFVTKDVGDKGTHYPGAIVKIYFRNGTSCVTKVEARKGSPLNPLSKDEVINKFIENSSMFLKKDRINEMIEKVMHLDDLKSIRDLIRCFNNKETYF